MRKHLALALLALVAFTIGKAMHASPLPPAVPITLDEAQGGNLLLFTDHEGLYLPAPILDTQVEIHATGIVARTTVHQRFWNRTAQWVEGVYVFPLPENAAVDTLRMKIGDRVIEGQIQEKEEARKTYEKAKADGVHASLVEQQRPNLFTTAVANLGPDEVVEVTIEYQQELAYQDGVFSLRFPMTALPRYSPSVDAEPSQPARAPAAVENPAVSELAPNPFSLTVLLHPGFELARLESSSHELVKSKVGALSHRVELAGQVVKPDRDFVLEWQPESGSGVHDAPEAGLFVEQKEEGSYALLMVMPPAELAASQADLAREVVFVIDTSGSMAGESMEAARQALLLALDRLDPRDSFNVIEFNSLVRKLFPGSVPAELQARATARRFLNGLTANGGTEMGKALEAALESPASASSPLRQVIFITDGAVDNEAQLFDYLRAHLGTNRLFTVGIGSAPNSYFMTEAAALGRGTFTYVSQCSEALGQMAALFAKLESPVATDLEVIWDDPAVDSYPAQVPDLYVGQPIVVTAKLGLAGSTGFTLRGRTGGAAWEVKLPALATAASAGLDKLWARRRVDELERELGNGGDPQTLHDALVEVGKTFHLVTRFTSLVAVDTLPARPAGEPQASTRIPVTPPAGWRSPLALGQLGLLPAGGSGAMRQVLWGLVMMLGALLAIPWVDSWRRWIGR